MYQVRTLLYRWAKGIENEGSTRCFARLVSNLGLWTTSGFRTIIFWRKRLASRRIRDCKTEIDVIPRRSPRRAYARRRVSCTWYESYERGMAVLDCKRITRCSNIKVVFHILMWAFFMSIENVDISLYHMLAALLGNVDMVGWSTSRDCRRSDVDEGLYYYRLDFCVILSLLFSSLLPVQCSDPPSRFCPQFHIHPVS